MGGWVIELVLEQALCGEYSSAAFTCGLECRHPAACYGACPSRGRLGVDTRLGAQVQRPSGFIPLEPVHCEDSAGACKGSCPITQMSKKTTSSPKAEQCFDHTRQDFFPLPFCFLDLVSNLMSAPSPTLFPALSFQDNY